MPSMATVARPAGSSVDLGVGDELPGQLDGPGRVLATIRVGVSASCCGLRAASSSATNPLPNMAVAITPSTTPPSGMMRALPAAMPPAATVMTQGFAAGVGKTKAASEPAEVCTRSHRPSRRRAG